MASRGKKLALNTVTSLSLQVVTVLCGFILPRLILGEYGTDVNGLVHSITQFLGVITLLDLGVGSVVQSALYNPLAEKDTDMISKIYVSANRFFRRLAMILVVYVAVLMLVYPKAAAKEYSFLYTVALIGAISINTFSQYYFGIVNTLLLNADQKGYIQYFAQIVVLILNTVVCAVLIHMGASIQIVKLTTSVIFLLRPLYLYFYVHRHYDIDSKITYDEEPIKQKWNGMAQHFASFVLSGTDYIVLTFFATYADVSIYSVYNTVVIGVKNALLSVTNGFQSLIGEMLAKKENDKVSQFFSYVEWLLHTGTTLLFGCTGILIVSFVSVYTKGVDDADYIQPLFGVLLVLANAGHCLRLPYNILILAAGHYKQTQSNYIIAMFMNIIISIAAVWRYGLVGVAIGTLAAMGYQTIWMAWYNSRNIIHWPFKNFLKQCGVDILTVLIASFASYRIPMLSKTYFAFVVRGTEVFAVWAAVTGIINFIFFRDKMQSLFLRIFKRFKRSAA